MSNEELISACVKGNTHAQGLLYKKYYNKLYSICLKYIKDEDDAMDCLQDGFLHIFKKLNELKYNYDLNIDSWLGIVMRNYCLDILRRKKNDVFFENIEIYESEIVDEEFTPHISHNTLLNLLETLKPQCKSIFTMFVIDNMKHKEIAKVLGINETTVRTNFHRAKKTLQNEINRLKLMK